MASPVPEGGSEECWRVGEDAVTRVRVAEFEFVARMVEQDTEVLFMWLGADSAYEDPASPLEAERVWSISSSTTDFCLPTLVVEL